MSKDRLEDLQRMADGWKSSGVRSLAVDIMEWAVSEIEKYRRQDMVIKIEDSEGKGFDDWLKLLEEYGSSFEEWHIVNWGLFHLKACRRSEEHHRNHCIQYALVGQTLVYHTEVMTDVDVQGRAGNHSPVERFDRCPTCESWTRINGELRSNIDCPAVKAELSKDNFYGQQEPK